MRFSFAIVITLFSSLLLNCSKGASSSGSDREPSTSTNPEPTPTPGTNPPVGTIEEDAGFFVEVTGDGKDMFNLHKGDDTFDEPCKMGDSDKIINCIVDAEEQSFYARPFSLHYHAPPSLCSYVSFQRFL